MSQAKGALTRHAPIKANGRPTSSYKPVSQARALTPRVRTAIEAMVFQGVPRHIAAEQAGLSDKGLYKAFMKQSVLTYYNKQLEVFRTGERARNLHTGVELRDQRESLKVALDAARWLHGEAVGQGGTHINVGVGVQVTPGYVLDLSDRHGSPTIEGQVVGKPKVEGT